MEEADLESLMLSLKRKVEEQKKAKAFEAMRKEKEAEAAFKSMMGSPEDEDGYAAVEAIKKALEHATVLTGGVPPGRTVTIKGHSVSMAPGGGLLREPSALEKAINTQNRVRIVPDPVAVFLARLSPETQEIIRLDLIARLAGIMSGLSEHKETEERIADLEMFDKLADKIAETPEWASF